MFHIILEYSPMPSTEGPNVILHFAFQIDMGIPISTGLLHAPSKDTAEEPDLVKSVRGQIADNSITLELCDQGTGGTYFVKDSHTNKRVAVFKPTDEEPGAPSNPKRVISTPLLPPGGGAIREVVAYLLDHEHRAGIPETYLVKDLEHPQWPTSGNPEQKTGSLQKYIPHFAASADMGSSLFSVEDVHNIGVFDLRVLNLDRNGENLLVVKDGDRHRLVPIDHSYILPPTVRKPYFEWLYWKQAKVPFAPHTLRYIANLDIEEDARILSENGIPAASIQTMKLTSLLLKKGAAAGLTLFQIASLVCADDEAEQSALESVVESAEEMSNGDEISFYQNYEQLVDALISNTYTHIVNSN